MIMGIFPPLVIPMDIIVKLYFAQNQLKISKFGHKNLFARVVFFKKVSLCGVVRISDVTCPPKNPNPRRIISTGD